jgi:hypothetical protein
MSRSFRCTTARVLGCSLSLFATTILSTGCVSDGDSTDSDEPVASTEDPITIDLCMHQTDTMPNLIPSGFLAPPAGGSSNYCINHEVDNVLGKDITVTSLAEFPQYTGAITTANINNCGASFVTMTLYKRVNATQAWTKFDYQKVFATPQVALDGNGLPFISKCEAIYEISPCNAIAFGTSNQLDVITAALAPSGLAKGGTKIEDLVQQPEINLADCP